MERQLTENEWRGLLADPIFMDQLIDALNKEVIGLKRTSFFVIQNWPLDAHIELFKMLPDELVNAFDLNVFRPNGTLHALNATEGFEDRGGHGICTAGWDFDRLYPTGDPKPLGPYANISFIYRKRLPIRLDLDVGISVIPLENDHGLMLIDLQDGFRIGQAYKLDSGLFCVVEEQPKKAPVVLSDCCPSRDAAADLLLASGHSQREAQP